MTANKQFQGSKKKARKKAFLEREDKRAGKYLDGVLLRKSIVEGDFPTSIKLLAKGVIP